LALASSNEKIGAQADPTDEEQAMTPQTSLTSVLAAIMLFAITVAMHEAARADSFVELTFGQQTAR